MGSHNQYEVSLEKDTRPKDEVLRDIEAMERKLKFEEAEPALRTHNLARTPTEIAGAALVLADDVFKSSLLSAAMIQSMPIDFLRLMAVCVLLTEERKGTADEILQAVVHLHSADATAYPDLGPRLAETWLRETRLRIRQWTEQHPIEAHGGS